MDCLFHHRWLVLKLTSCCQGFLLKFVYVNTHLLFTDLLFHAIMCHIYNVCIYDSNRWIMLVIYLQSKWQWLNLLGVFQAWVSSLLSSQVSLQRQMWSQRWLACTTCKVHGKWNLLLSLENVWTIQWEAHHEMISCKVTVLERLANMRQGVKATNTTCSKVSPIRIVEKNQLNYLFNLFIINGGW